VFHHIYMKVDLSNGDIEKINLYNHREITELNISRNNLKEFPEWIAECTNLIYLNCNFNKLLKLAEKLPDSLRTLDCSYNQLTELPNHLPTDLQYLYCNHNLLESLPEKLPISLKMIYCYYNKIQVLPTHIPDTLRMLYCSNNLINLLPEKLPNFLRTLNCACNELTRLPKYLPTSLEYIYVISNKLTHLPISLINCEDLKIIYYSDNPMENINPIILRFLNQIKNRYITIYNDRQSVHNGNIQESIRQSIVNILSDQN
jgi:Leucine-rich repeat (LRR) protein